MKTQNQVRITNENVRITENNVQHIGECIALSAIKKMMRFAHHPRSLDKLYAGLVEDIYLSIQSSLGQTILPYPYPFKPPYPAQNAQIPLLAHSCLAKIKSACTSLKSVTGPPYGDS